MIPCAGILLTSIASLASTGSTLHVRVVDPSGKPCGSVPLAIRSALVGGTVPAASSTTNAEGIAEFADAERWYTDAVRAQIPQVVADVPLAKECSMPLLQHDVPKDALVLALPVTGSFVAHITKPAEGSRDPVVSDVRVEWTDPGLGVTRSLSGAPCAGQTDCARFAWIGTALDLRFTLGLADGRTVSAGTVRGPANAGEERVIEVGNGQSVVHVNGRALDASGKPLANAGIFYDVQPAAGMIKHIFASQNGTVVDTNQFRSTQTDAEGKFRLDLVRPRREGPGWDEWIRPFETTWSADPWLNFAWAPKSDPNGADAVRASIVIKDRRIDTNDLPLGDLQFAAPRILARGTVRDADGTLLKGANVRVVQRLEAIGPPSGSGGSSATRVAEWRALEAGSAQSAVNGGYTLHERVDVHSDAASALAAFCSKHPGAECRSTLYLNIERDPLLPALIDLAGTNGATDVDAQLTRGSDVHGKLVLDPGVDPAILDVMITCRAPTPLSECLQQQNTGGRGPGPARVDKSGSIFWRMLPPGIVDVRITRKGGNAVLFELKGFDVATETASLNESLAEIDLRGKVR